ncbi:DUF1580 domain-containing protein [Paludisphaera sp.]|uniref:DUF1580 domain-containing protein n=1 Tax=Paludisphaera sp. TaxID=2017432 RepID=UPI00301BBEBE
MFSEPIPETGTPPLSALIDPREPDARTSPAPDRLLSARDVTEILPRRRRGRKLHVATVHRWWTTGYRGVVLGCVRIGNQRFTSMASLESFIRRMSELDRRASPGETSGRDAAPPTAAPASNLAERRRRVRCELERNGL